jgi:ABC-type multidrug transport system fused ATPase/permease subunit
MLIKTSYFADNLVPRIAATDVTRLEEKEGGIRHLLVDSLSEGYRLSAEALESTISDYHDSILVSVSLAIVLFMTSFALMIVEFADSQLDIAAVAGLPLALALVLISFLTWFVSRHYRPFIMRLRSWYDRFQDALEFEAVGGEVRDDWQSSFELLAEATKELPKWILTRQKSMLHTHPAVSSLMFVLALIGFNMFVSAAFILQDWWAILTAIVALSILGLSAWLFYATRRNDQEESHRTMSEWRARLDRTSAEAERLIEDM